MPNEACLYNEWHLNNGIKYRKTKHDTEKHSKTEQRKNNTLYKCHSLCRYVR